VVPVDFAQVDVGDCPQRFEPARWRLLVRWEAMGGHAIA
jgi:hypothetical protein